MQKKETFLSCGTFFFLLGWGSLSFFLLKIQKKSQYISLHKYFLCFFHTPSKTLRLELEHDKKMEVETMQSEFRVQLDVELKKQAAELPLKQDQMIQSANSASMSSPPPPLQVRLLSLSH